MNIKEKLEDIKMSFRHARPNTTSKQRRTRT